MPTFLFRNISTNELLRASGAVPFDARAVLPDGQWQVAVVGDWAENEIDTTAAAETHVFLIAGQSNAISRVPFDGGADWPAGVRQYGRFAPNADVLINARRPLDHWNQPVADGMGWALQFSIDYLAAHPGVELVLVPAASGGTGFFNNRWNPGDNLYQDAVSRVNAVMSANPTFTFSGILWHQGEADSHNNAAALGHRPALHTMISAMRADIQAADDQTPFVLGGMVPSLVAASTDRQIVQATLEDVPNRIAHTAYVDSTGLSAIADGVHFNGASMRALGTRYVAALSEAPANTQVLEGWEITDQTIHSYEYVSVPRITGTTVLEGI